MSAEKTLQLTISKVDGPLFDGKVLSVLVPGISGDMQILANHEALISPLRTGSMVIEKIDGSKETIEIESGTLEVSHNQVTILV